MRENVRAITGKVYIRDLIGDGPRLIQNKTFHDCELIGPAVFSLVGTGHLGKNTIVADSDLVSLSGELSTADARRLLDGQAAFYTELPNASRLAGTIIVTNTTIERCRLYDIGFTGTSAALQGIKSSLQGRPK